MRPETLSDVVLSLALTGYYDDELRSRIEESRPRRAVQTRLLSGARLFPDGFYHLQNGGPAGHRLSWPVDGRFVASGRLAGRLRNFGLTLVPRFQTPGFRRVLAVHFVEVQIDAAGQIRIVTPVPAIALEIQGLRVKASVAFEAAVDRAEWRWADGSSPDPVNLASTPGLVSHDFPRAGSYASALRVVRQGRMYEFALPLTVSKTRNASPPCLAWPEIQLATGNATEATVRLKRRGDPAVTGTLSWATRQTFGGEADDLHLPSGRTHFVGVTIVRDLRVRLDCNQRFDPGREIVVHALRVSTNRIFDAAGTVLNGSGSVPAQNGLATQWFTAGEVSPLDEWRLAIDPVANGFLDVYDTSDRASVDLSELSDCLLTLEYEAESTVLT